ncbi:MAG: dihydrofolate reductase [Blastochloris sp.]|nr:dihydrofolate reductase [Blastochloris sp.]
MLILSTMVSLDGYVAAPGEGWEQIDWHRADDAWERYSMELLDGADTLLLGRRTYEGFAAFWPEQVGELAQRLNTVRKVVVSTTLAAGSWRETQVIRDRVPEAIAALKAESGRDILIFGSGELSATLTRYGLIDEYRLAFNPVVLGGGTPLFTPGAPRLNLAFVGVKPFASGVVELRYRPEPGVMP